MVAGTSTGKAGSEPRLPAHVHRLHPDLAHASADNLTHDRRIDPGARNDLFERDGEQIDRMESRKRAASLSNRGPDCLDNDNVVHVNTFVPS